MQNIRAQAPRLNRLQQAWLQEIGLDRRMLAQYVTPTAAPVAKRAPQEPTEQPQSLQPSLQPLQQKPAGGGLQATRELLRTPPQPKAGKPAAQLPDAPRAPVPETWQALISHIDECRACGLHMGRSHAVSGSGAEHAPEWLVVGEAPGSVDDRTGLPFQGKAGQLLQAMLASIQVTEQTPVFFTNVIKCRPLGNRPPTQEEILACMPYLQRQIALLKPHRILALGSLAAQALLGLQDDLEALRGKVHSVRSEAGQDIPVVVTYHPTALLLRPQHKPDAWRDLNLARGMLTQQGASTQ
ncbi:uracil-DNA glycosylase [Pollutimonas harenae]|uniref:Type-4 uracil-DNA glycosylase n=1 Tax=Pollutimonas harenae TaxID=657015 RepID=A0A853H0C8_9BURK|nr:uracil-DNA glycosylase [Pollutimonas harenae]NYT85490.1 uracil-DNA glycosylase [Pollutimonas harenae]TEA70579.1 uracil-DNA glycosylase [Pollutimonas harenae]